MVAAATLFIALLAASSQAIASHNFRSLHDGSHHHIAAVVRDHVSPNVGGPLAKRHESNKKRTNTKRARRCKPRPKADSAPTKNTSVKDKDDDPKDSPKDDPKPPKVDPKPPKDDPKPPKDDPKPPKDTPKPPPKDDDGPGDGKYSGDGTYYATGLNACGTTDQDTDYIAAVSHALFDSFPGHTANPNNNPICDRKLRAHYKGKSVVVKVTDRCGGCEIFGSLDFSPSAFKQLANLDVGRIHGVTWDWI